jgi:glycosyltransferase involved in cell wall biosynthesis
MHRFAIVTPTVAGRERLLLAALATANAQDFRDFVHLVVSDGPANDETKKACAFFGATLAEVEKVGRWGYNCRNHAIQKMEPVEYYVFLDDDNLVYRGCLWALDQQAKASKNPPLIAHRIHYLKRWEVEQGRMQSQAWMNLPWEIPPVKGGWDQLNTCVRRDVALAVPFKGEYEQDFYFIQECIAFCKQQPVMTEAIGGVHI